MSSSDDEQEEYGPKNYTSRAHKLATLFIMTAGSANATQFPMMFIVNGGLPFLLAYLAFLAVVSLPIMHLESGLAQFAGDGHFGVFSTVPLFLGLGITMGVYAIVHIVADSVPVTDQLLYLLDSLREAAGNECRYGMLLAPNRTCYVPRHPFSLCRFTRARLTEAFRRRHLTQGMSTVDASDEGAHVTLVPPEVYHHDMASCLPGVYNYLQPYQLRRHGNWFEESSSALIEIRGQRLLSLAAIWMVVFALAHQGFNRVKWFVYMMVCIHVTTTVLLLVRAATLPGAMSGLGTMFYTDWSYVVNVKMWCNALYVSLESVGVTGSIYLGIVRFNNFKNDYQRDVYFVLVADTATELLRTAITFMFLGHLASTIGTDVRTLVGRESSLVVGILPEALSVVPYQQLWSQVHALWLLSTMLPKFFIVPDIVIEVLTQAQPYTSLNRTLIHFFVCVTLLMTSVAICSPGGANMAAIIAHNHDQKLRFVLLFLESIVLLQFYGVRRLDIACRMMSGRDGSDFVKVCLASVIPLVVISLFFVKIVSKHSEDGTYPIWIYAVITWLWLVQLSFIPVFAVVLLTDVNLTLRNLLIPLPTWVPLDWEHAMYYRKTLVVEGFDSDAAKNPNPRSSVQARRRQSSKQSKRAGGKRGSRSSKSSTELLASDFVVASDGAFVLPGTNTMIKERQTKSGAPGQSGVASLSGTVHVSRHLSSIRRSAQRQRLELQAYENVSPVAMALASEAEVDEPHGVRAAAANQPISGSGPSVKESLQVAGVLAAPYTQLSGKIGPEASNIANEVFPASSAVYDDIHKERSGLKVQGDLTKLSDKHLAVDVKGSTYPTTTPKKLIEKPSLVKSTYDDAHVSSKSVRQQKSRRSLEKLPSDKSSTRGIEKPADVTVPQVVADGDRMSKTGALEKQRGSITSKKSRMSVDEMLILNKQLPSDSDQGVLQSDVNVVVAVVPQPAAESEAVEGALMKEEPDGQQAKPELEEQQPQVKQQPLRGEMVAVGGPEQSAEVGRGSTGKNAKGGSSKHSKARRRRLKQLGKRQAVKKRKVAPLIPYKPTMALVSVESDSTYMRIPTTSGATVKQGKQGVPCAAQEELPELEEPRRKSVGQEDASSSSRRASKSSESVAKLAFAQHEAPVDAKVEDKPARAEGSGKKTSLSASYLRLREESAAAKRPHSRPGTRTSLQEEDRGANKDAAMAGRDVLEPAVPEAERQGGMFEPIQRVPIRKEGSQANVAALIPDDKRQKESKQKSLRKGRKRHHKKTTG